jgi:hypothetical protein
VKSFPLAHIFASSDDMELNIEVKLIKIIKKVLNVFLVQVNFIQLFFLVFFIPGFIYILFIFFFLIMRELYCSKFIRLY